MRARLLFLVFLVALLATNLVFGKTFNVTTPVQFQSALTEAQSNGEDDTINVAEGHIILAPLPLDMKVIMGTAVIDLPSRVLVQIRQSLMGAIRFCL